MTPTIRRSSGPFQFLILIGRLSQRENPATLDGLIAAIALAPAEAGNPRAKILKHWTGDASIPNDRR